jgi:MFS family permease
MSLVWAAVGVLAILAYRRHAARVDRPVVRFEHVFHRPYSVMGLTIAAMITAAFSANVYVTLYVSAGRGAGPSLTAWSVFFFTIGWTLGANGSSRLLDRMAESSVIRTGVFITAPGLALTAAAVRLDMPLAFVFAGLLAGGLGIGMATNAALTLLRAVTPDAEIGRAASAHQFIRNQGFTLGSALGGSVLLLVVGSRLGTVEPVERLLSGDATGVGPQVSEAVAAGYGTTVFVGLVISLFSIIPLRLLRRHLAVSRAAADERRSNR